MAGNSKAIFGATVRDGGARMFQVGAAAATFGGGKGSAGTQAVLLGVTVQIQRQFTQIPTITDGIMWAAQPVSGVLTAQSVVTKGKTSKLMETFTQKDACSPQPVSIELNDGACDASGVTLKIQDGYCSAVSFVSQGAQGYIANDLTIQFTTCEYSESGGNATTK